MDDERLAEILTREFTLTNPYFFIGAVGCAFWIAAYVLGVMQGFKDKSYPLPAAAICLNFSWEIMATTMLSDPIFIWRVFEWGWLVVDLVIVYLLFRYGPSQQDIPELRDWFVPLCLVGIVAGLVGQYTFVWFFHDDLGFIAAFIINLVMSILFIPMYWRRRPGNAGISLAVAWCKMLGTVGTAIQCWWLIPTIRPDQHSWAFMLFLYVAIFLADATYVLLLTRDASSSRKIASASA